MTNLFSKSSGLTKNLSDNDFKTLCSWLRDIHNQNVRLLNLMKVLNNAVLQSTSPSEEPVLDDYGSGTV